MKNVNGKRKKCNGKESDSTISSKTVHNEFGLIRTILSLHTSIDLDVRLPQTETNQHELSSPDVIYDIVKGTDIELPVLLAIWLSFTMSEIFGLTKSKSISSDGNFITIKEVIITDEHNNTVIKNKGKQKTRDRTLRIPDYIKHLIAEVETDRLVTMTRSSLYHKWIRLIKKAGIPHMSFHDLRHVNASVMTILNIPYKYAQERGGWKTDHVMKSKYMQTFSNQRIAVDNRIDAYMYDVLFNDSQYKKKYESFLMLFDLSDSEYSTKLFEEFCTKNGIAI